jgi:hypothetical protein
MVCNRAHRPNRVGGQYGLLTPVPRLTAAATLQPYLYVLIYFALNSVLTLRLVLTARDAWIQADVNRYAGANKCILWNAFASRGLGVNAASHNDDTTVPSGC